MTALADRRSARGGKHRCAACGAAFYDMGRDLAACPKCETPYAEAASIPTGERGGRKRTFHRGSRSPASESQQPAQEPRAAEPDGDDGAVPMLDAPENVDAEQDDAETSDAAESTDEPPDETDTDGR